MKRTDRIPYLTMALLLNGAATVLLGFAHLIIIARLHRLEQQTLPPLTEAVCICADGHVADCPVCKHGEE